MIIYKKCFLAVLFSISVIGLSVAQTLITTAAAPFPTDRFYETLSMDKGVFSLNIDRDNHVIHYFFTDEDLNIINFGKSDFADYPVRIMKKVKGDKAYVFFNFLSEGNWQKIVMTIDSNTGEVLFIPIQNFVMATITDFYVLDNRIAMVGLYKKNLNMIQFLDIYQKNQEPYTVTLDMKIYDISASGDYLDILASKQKGNKLELLTFNEKGEKQSTIKVESGFNKKDHVRSAVLHKNDNHQFSIGGIYSESRWSDFSGYFVWSVEPSSEQDLAKFPTSAMKGLSGKYDKITNNQINDNVKRGYRVIKVLEDNGQLAIISEPKLNIFEKGMFHIVKISDARKLVWDETLLYERTLMQYLKSPPLYMVDGNVYFFNHQEYPTRSQIFVHNSKSDEKYGTDFLSNLIPSHAPIYNIMKFKDNEIIIFGLKENKIINENFFMVKFPQF